MSKPIILRTADIYLRFPEIMEEECDDLADFLQDKHIVYEGATDVFIKKDKELERLNNIINELEKFMDEDYEYYKKYGSAEQGHAMGQIRRIKNKLQKLKGSGSNE